MTVEESLVGTYLNEALQDELELLKEIFFKEIKLLDRGDELEIQVSVTPSTGDRWDLKYVFLDLVITINKLEYPDEKPPTFKLNRVRGISQEHQEKILHDLSKLAASRLGDNILYDLIEFVQETLTENNMPAGNCPICLESFSGYCHFTITECTHYFHMACLNEHLKHLDKTEEGFTEPRCPSCREILDDDYVEALQRNTNELGLKCNLHKAGKEKLTLSPSIREQTRKYKEMFEAMYLKQKANNSFFTGDTHVLDLTSRSVVARSLENVAQQQQLQQQQQEQEQLDQKQDQLDQQELPSSSVEKSAPPVDNPLQEKGASDESLIISFSNLLGTTTPDPNNLSQDKLGSTCSTAPSNVEDSQSELSVSLSHQSELSINTSQDGIQQAEKDDLCYTEDEEEEEEKESAILPAEVVVDDSSTVSDEDNAAQTYPEVSPEYVSFTKEAKIVNIEEETPEQIHALREEEEKEKEEFEEEEKTEAEKVAEEEISKVVVVEDEPLVEEDQEITSTNPELESVAEEVMKEEDTKAEPSTAETDSEKIEENTEEVALQETVDDEVQETVEKEESVGVVTQTTIVEEEEVFGGVKEEEEEEDEVSEVSEVSQKTVSFNDDSQSKNKSTESREIQTQTRRVKRNRNRRRSSNRDGNFREGDSGRGGGRGGYNNNNNNHHHGNQRGGGFNPHNQQEGEVVYRRAERGRGGNRGDNCRSFHEGDNHGNRNKQEYRRHSFSEHSQNWRSDNQPGDKRHHRPRDHFYPQQPPQQPRFKPPRILRQEALAQAKKLSQALSNQEQLTPNMHKIPVSMYNPNGGAGAPPQLGPPSFPPVFHGYQMTQIPPHLYQATNNYHHSTRKQPHSGDSRDPRVADPRAPDPRASDPRPQTKIPPPSSSRPSDLPSLSNTAPLSKPVTSPHGSTNKSLSPTSHNKIFDVSRFQQSILRNNTSPTSGSSGSSK